MKIWFSQASNLNKASLVAALALLAGCAAPAGQDVNDPLEPMNRKVHGFNKGIDKLAFSPASQAYGTIIPAPARQAVNNVAETLDLPGIIANDLMQLKMADATTNTLRLGVNLTFGVAGLFDFASAIGMPKTDNDFGLTLAAWGVNEGPYVELPLLGPSTGRDALGEVVDIAMNPLNNVFDGDDAKAVTAAKVLSIANDRYRYSNTVDSILYESADSYAQARLLYLQNRRYEVAGGPAEAGTVTDDFIDPYEDINGQ